MTISEAKKKAMQRTARSGGAVGSRAVVPRIVEACFSPDIGKVLDFGCGEKQLHVQKLLQKGFDVAGHDFSLPKTPGGKFELIYLSNVVNYLQQTLRYRFGLQEASRHTPPQLMLQ